MPGDVVWKVHPGSEYIVKEWLDHIEQRRMPTCKRWIEVEIAPLIFQKDIAEVRIAMTNDGHSSACRVEHDFSAFDQLTQCVLLLGSIDDPAIRQQRIERYICTMLTWKRNMFPLVKALKAFARQAMPEELMNGCMGMLLGCTQSKCCLIDIEQAFAFLSLGRCQCFSRCRDAIYRVLILMIRLERTYEVEHDGPAHHRIDDHLPPLLVQRAQRLDDVVTGLV